MPNTPGAAVAECLGHPSPTTEIGENVRTPGYVPIRCTSVQPQDAAIRLALLGVVAAATKRGRQSIPYRRNRRMAQTLAFEGLRLCVCEIADPALWGLPRPTEIIS